MGRKQKYTKEEVSKALKKTGYLSQIKIDQHPNLPSCMTVLKLFKTTKINDVWNELDISFTPLPSYTKEEVSKTLKETGYLSQRKIVQHPDLPSARTILRLFKTTNINDVWNELGILFPSYTKEEVSKALKKIGYLPQREIDQHPDLPSYSTIRKLFKTTNMADAWKELDIPFPSSYTKESVFKALKKTGYLPQRKIAHHPDLPAHTTVLKLFKTTKINNVWKELSIPVPTLSQSKYTKKEVSKALKKTGYLSQKEINQHPDLPSYSTIRRLFNTTKMSDVWKQLNIKPQRKNNP